MPGPGYLIVALKVQNRDSAYILGELRGPGTPATSAPTRDARRIITGIRNLLNGANGGAIVSDLWVAIPGTNAAFHTRTITCTQANAAADTVTFARGGVSVVLTEGTDFARGASDTTCALALSNAINAHAVLKTMFAASPAAGVVTLTPKFPTQLTADWTLATSDGTAFAFATTVQGTEGTALLPLSNVLLHHTP